MKKYTLTIDFNGKYLHATISGQNTLENVLQFFDEVYDACLKYQCNTLLIEENLTGPNLNTFEVFEVILKNFQRALLLNVRIAYVDLNTEQSKRGVKFAENLAHIRGVNVRLFDNTQEAVHWLLSNERSV